MAGEEGKGGAAAEDGGPPGGWHAGLWDFSLAAYEQAPVRDACHALQDGLGADVNMLLLCCWLGATGRGRLDDEDLARLADACRAWQDEVVAPLRRARRWLGAPPPAFSPQRAGALRAAIEAAELEAERIEQEALALAIPRQPVRHDAARRARDTAASLDAYLAFIGARPGEAVESAVAVITAACCR